MHEWWVATMSRAAEEGDCVAGCSSSEVAGMGSGVLCVGAEGMRGKNVEACAACAARWPVRQW